MRYPTQRVQNRSSRKVEDSRVFYHPELDVLRFVAFLGVFLHHALPRDASVYVKSGFSPTLSEWLVTAKKTPAPMALISSSY